VFRRSTRPSHRASSNLKSLALRKPIFSSLSKALAQVGSVSFSILLNDFVYSELLAKYKLRQISDLKSSMHCQFRRDNFYIALFLNFAAGVAEQLKFSSYPSTALTLSATLASGRTPSKHGIVANKWIGRKGI